MRIGEQIDLRQRRLAVRAVGRAAARGAEFPSRLAVKRLGDGNRNNAVELLQGAEDQSAMRPGAGQRNDRRRSPGCCPLQELVLTAPTANSRANPLRAAEFVPSTAGFSSRASD